MDRAYLDQHLQPTYRSKPRTDHLPRLCCCVSQRQSRINPASATTSNRLPFQTSSSVQSLVNKRPTAYDCLPTMSQSTPSNSLMSMNTEMRDLVEEIEFQKVLLASIDDSTENRAVAENEVKDEIRKLESQLRTLKRKTKASQLPSSQQSPIHSGPPNPSCGKTAELSEDDSALPSANREPSSISSMPSTPNSTYSLAGLRDLVSPSQMTLPSRKRTHSHLGGGVAPSVNKSRRTSPGLPRPITSASIMSSDDDDLEAFSNHLLLQQYKAAEERARQLRLDEEYARNLDQSQDFQPSGSSSVQNSSTSNAFSRMSGAHLPPPPTFGGNPAAGSTSGRRTLPWIKPEPSVTSGIRREEPSTAATGFASYATMQGHRLSIKPEPYSLRPMPGTFRDDSSVASDSDIEIIPPSAFHDNGRHGRPDSSFSQSGQTVKSSPGSIAAGHAALNCLTQNPATANYALQKALFGDRKPAWMAAGSTPASSSQNPFAGKSEYMYHGMHTPGPGQNYTMNNIPVYNGNYDSLLGSSNIFNHLPQADSSILDDIISRSGPSNYHELSRHLGLDANMNDRLDYVLNDPRQNRDQIKELLAGIVDQDLAPEDREGTPDGMVYPLYEHQKLALTWLKNMEEGPKKGGILADDMGLGKTISSLALMLSRPSVDPLCKTTLIVGPVALVRQWDREIKKKIKASHRLSTYMLHGSGKRLSWDDIRNYDVVLTTYGTLGSEYKRLSRFLDERKNQEYDEAPMRKLFPTLGPRSSFYRILLDEAQCIKNKSSLAARAACHIDAKYRFCLTGTPMMNNVGELYSLIRFLRIKPYNEWSRFSSEFGCLSTATKKNFQDPANAMRKFQVLRKAIMLRRTKTSLIDGHPIITLPPKTEHIDHVVFDEDETDFYKTLEANTQVKFNKYLKAGTVTKNYSNILVLLLRLRQACCHPHLIQDFEELPVAGSVGIEGMMDLARGLAPNVIARLLAADDAFECPVCYDGVPNPKIVIPCGHDTCSECLTKITDSAVQQNVANGQENSTNARCPTCRGEIDISKVIDYSAFVKVHKPEEVAEEAVPASESSDESTDDSDSEEEQDDTEEDDDMNSDGDLLNFVVPDDINDESTGSEGDDEAEDKFDPKGKGKALARSKPKGNGKQKSKAGEKDKKGKKKEKNAHVSIAMLKQEANKTKEGRRKYMRYLKKNWQPSAKITKCVELLEQFREEGEKVIIFSQFVSLLDLLQIPINENRWKCLRYDGSMTADERNDAIVNFTDSKEYNIMLISLKAGNAGLNLVAASRVIILDPFWNPYIEMQAVDRAYRIGQQKEVHIHRILIQGTVEDRIIALQDKKRALVESALDEGASREVGRLDVQQLAFLFGVPS